MNKSRAEAKWGSDSDNAESETKDASENEKSALPPSDSEDDSPLGSHKKHASWRFPKTKNIPKNLCRYLPWGASNTIEYFQNVMLTTF